MIPALLSLQDCADYTKTVQPFLPQLYALPQVLMNNGADLAGLKGIYIETNPLVTGFSVSVLLGAIFLAVSELNRNYSQVDRMWSILPNLYVIHFAVWARLAGFAHHRLDLVAIATTIWSVCCYVERAVSIFAEMYLVLTMFLAGSPHLQLLAQGWLQYWLRGLQMVHHHEAGPKARLLPLQCHLHLLYSEHSALRLFCCPRLRYPARQPF